MQIALGQKRTSFLKQKFVPIVNIFTKQMAKIKQAQEQHANHQEKPSNYIISVVCFTLVILGASIPAISQKKKNNSTCICGQFGITSD